MPEIYAIMQTRLLFELLDKLKSLNTIDWNGTQGPKPPRIVHIESKIKVEK